MKGCELCDRAARMYCESDQASLCWECDARVHGANFLVARHSRSLLCRRCQSPTPWRAAGARLGPTVSVCERCVGSRDGGAKLRDRREDDDVDAEEEDDDGGEGEADDEEEEEEEEEESEGGAEEDGEQEEEEEDGDNQVVPWTLTPPPEASSSSSEDSSSRTSNRFLKRSRENADLASQDARACSSSHPSYVAVAPGPSPQILAPAAAEDEATSFLGPLRPAKRAAHLRPAFALALAQPLPAARSHRDHRTVDLVSSSSHSPPI